MASKSKKQAMIFKKINQNKTSASKKWSPPSKTMCQPTSIIFLSEMPYATGNFS